MGFGVWGLEGGVSGFGLRVHVLVKGCFARSTANQSDGSTCVKVGAQGSGFRIQGPGSRVQGSGFRVQISGSRVQGPGSRVQGSGFRHQRAVDETGRERGSFAVVGERDGNVFGPVERGGCEPGGGGSKSFE